MVRFDATVINADSYPLSKIALFPNWDYIYQLKHPVLTGIHWITEEVARRRAGGLGIVIGICAVGKDVVGGNIVGRVEAEGVAGTPITTRRFGACVTIVMKLLTLIAVVTVATFTS
jgi:hypothetical protein